MCVCVCVCKQLPSNQSFDKQISSHQKGGGVNRWGKWVGKATAYKFDKCTLIRVHSTMHLVDPIKVHVSFTCVCVCVCVLTCSHVYIWSKEGHRHTHTWMHTHAHTHAHTHTHTHTFNFLLYMCVWSCVLQWGCTNSSCRE